MERHCPGLLALMLLPDSTEAVNVQVRPTLDPSEPAIRRVSDPMVELLELLDKVPVDLVLSETCTDFPEQIHLACN